MLMLLCVPSFAIPRNDKKIDDDMIPLSDNIKIYYDAEQDTLVISEKNNSPELYWNAGIGRCKLKYKTFYKTFSRKATKKYL